MKSTIALITVLAIPSLAFGAASFTLTQGGSGPSGATAITINPGDSFDLDLGITQESGGVASFDGALIASTDDVFYMTARTWQISYVDVNFLTMGMINDTNKWLKTTPLRQQNFGGIHQTDYWPAAQFPATIATFTLATESTATPGVYTITIGDPGSTISIFDQDVVAQTPLTLGELTVTIQGNSGGSGGTDGGGTDGGGTDGGGTDGGGTDGGGTDGGGTDGGGTDGDGTDGDGTDGGVTDGGGTDGGDGSTPDGNNNQTPVVTPSPVVCGPGAGGALMMTMLGLGLIGRFGRKD